MSRARSLHTSLEGADLYMEVTGDANSPELAKRIYQA